MIKDKVSIRLIFFLVLSITIIGREAILRIVEKSPYLTPKQVKDKSLEYEPTPYTKLAFPLKELKKSVDYANYHVNYYINENGYRGRNFSIKKPKDKIRIMFSGGSATFDLYANDGQDWPHLIEEILKKKGFNNIEVINAGVPMLNSIESFNRIFTEGHLFEPDYIVLYEAYNDTKYFHTKEPVIRWRGVYTRQFDPRIDYHNFADKFLSEHSQVYLLLRNAYYSRSIGLEGKKIHKKNYHTQLTDEALKQYELSIRMFVDLARDINAEPILMTQSRLVTKDLSEHAKKKINKEHISLTDEAWCEAFQKADEITTKTANEKNVYLIDSSKYLTGKEDLFVDHIHLSPLGSQKLAELVAEHFIKILQIRASKVPISDHSK